MPDPTSKKKGGTVESWGHPILQVSINLDKKGKEIHILYAPDRLERDYSRDEFDLLLSALWEWVMVYRMFSEPWPDVRIFQE